MELRQTGALLASLRAEKAMTQRAVAERLGVSVQAVSKWERGLGCPDVELLPQLAAIYAVPVERLLAGELDPNDKETGNMKRLKFYVCPDCGNILTAAGRAELHCCGRTLEPLTARGADAAHRAKAEAVEDEWYVTFDHPMTKTHFLRFFAWVGTERVLLVRLYPEQDAAFRIPQLRCGKWYACCSEHGLFEVTPEGL